MRIAHVLLSSGFAGSERATAELCNAHCVDHCVLLVVQRAHRRYGASIRDHLDSRVQVVEIGRWWQQWALKAALTRFQPAVIHAHLRRSTRLLARLGLDVPTVATLHLSWNGRHFAAMNGIICIADWQRLAIPSSYRGQVFRIDESFIPHRRLNPAERAALRTELGASEGDYLIGGVGRLTHSKGFDVLVKAFRRAALPGTRLVIIGAGRQLKQLRRLASDAGGNIAFAGFRSDAKDCFQAFDLFISPSRSEPLGRVLLEAYDAGVPVIATRTAGPNELVARFGGELVDIGDDEALAGAMQRAWRLRLPAKPVELSVHHIDNIARQTLEGYSWLIDHRKTFPSAAPQPHETGLRLIKPDAAVINLGPLREVDRQLEGQPDQ